MTDTELKEKIDGLLDNWFRPHQDYIYNPHATKDFLDAAISLIQAHTQQQVLRGQIEIIKEFNVQDKQSWVGSTRRNLIYLEDITRHKNFLIKTLKKQLEDLEGDHDFPK